MSHFQFPKPESPVLSIAYQDYFGGSMPFGAIARPFQRAYNRLTLVQEFSVGFRVATRKDAVRLRQ